MLLSRRSSQLFKSHFYGLFSTVASVEPKVSYDEFRTSENDPSKHSREHIGKYYKIDDSIKKKLYGHGGLIKKYEEQIKTFTEACLMIRSPSIEIKEYIEKTDFSKPVVRYVLYGEPGTGKTMSIAHLLHYGYQNSYCLVHVPYLPDWYKRPKECGPSSRNEAIIDIPLDSAAWLVHFKSQNLDLLTKLDLRTTKDYEWSKRESTPANSTILELIDHGINRAKYASDVIAALLSEIKSASTEGKIKTMVLIDGYNALFHQNTRVFTDRKKKYPVTPDKVTITSPFLNITNYDWCNGVVVLSVDIIGMLGWDRLSYLPRYLLGKEGFEHLDPFVPIKTNNYSEKEFNSCIQYFVERKWIQNTTPGFDKEIQFLSNSNPFSVMDICKAL